MNFRMRATALTSLLVLLATSACAGNASSTETDAGQSSSLEPVEVVITSLPPYVTKGDDGRLEGLDGGLFDDAAKQLGFEYNVTVTDWNGMLAAVQSGRADLAVSDVAWTPAREETGLFTDPAYYLPNMIGQTSGLDVQTVDDLVGHSVGAINGQSYVDGLDGVDGVDLRLYPDSAALLADLSASRIDAAIMDPLVMVYQKQVRPDLNYEVAPLAPPTMDQVSKHPKWTVFGPQMIGWYAKPGSEAFVDQLNGVIQEYWTQGSNASRIKDAGVDQVAPFLNPGTDWLSVYEEQRQGVDRPDKWAAPYSDKFDGEMSR